MNIIFVVLGDSQSINENLSRLSKRIPFFFKFPHLKGFVTEDILLSEALFLLLTVVICKLLLKKPIHATS